MATAALSRIGVGGPWPFWAGELWAMPALPPGANAYPLTFHIQLATTTYRPLTYISVTPDTPGSTQPHNRIFPLDDLDEEMHPPPLLWRHYGQTTFSVSALPNPRPTVVAIGQASGGTWPDQVLSLTVEYTDPGGGGGAGEVRFTKAVEGVALTEIMGTYFQVTAAGEGESQTAALQVVAPGTILSKTVALSAGLNVTFSENLDLLPTEIGGRATRWADPVFTPSSVTVVEDATIDVMVWNRVTFPGGAWPVRQRQSLIGGGSWPLRQRQNGAHSGSWPLRQTQAGI